MRILKLIKNKLEIFSYYANINQSTFTIINLKPIIHLYIDKLNIKMYFTFMLKLIIVLKQFYVISLYGVKMYF